MIDILKIGDDCWSIVAANLSPLEFISVSSTCCFFYNLRLRNKYWQNQCKALWTQIESNKVATIDWYTLFKAIVDFIIKICEKKSFQYVPASKRSAVNIYRNTTTQTILFRPSNYTIDKLFPGLIGDILFGIIAENNLPMFKVLISNIGNEQLHGYSKLDGFNYTTTATDWSGETPLSFACKMGNIEIVSLLLRHPKMTSAAINKKRMYGYGASALYNAVCRGNICFASKDSYDSSYNEQTALGITQLLLDDERTDINMNLNNNCSYTALMASILDQNGYISVISKLIQNTRVDVNIQDNVGNSALHMAALKMQFNQHNHTDSDDDDDDDDDDYYYDYDYQLEEYEKWSNKMIQVAQCLLQRKDLDINLKNNENQTALDLAVNENFDEMVVLLKAYSNK